MAMPFRLSLHPILARLSRAKNCKCGSSGKAKPRLTAGGKAVANTARSFRVFSCLRFRVISWIVGGRPVWLYQLTCSEVTTTLRQRVGLNVVDL